MKLLLWLGNESNQMALAHKLAKDNEIVGVITETRPYKRKLTPKSIGNSLFEKTMLPQINEAWFGMKDHYKKIYESYPSDNILDTENINSEEAYTFSKDLNPDLIIVSGTRLVKSKMLSIPCSKGILNLHTGLSPYIKGGPNCTNWCLAIDKPHLIGNTIMWIDEGIDSGNIVTTEFTPLTYKESLKELHLKVMDHAHDLYCRAVQFLDNGGESNVPQSEIAKGETFYTKQWSLREKKRMMKNYNKHFSPTGSNNEKALNRNNVKTVSLERS